MKATPDQSDRLHRFAHDLRNRLAAIQQAIMQLHEAPEADRGELIHFAEQQYFKAMRSTEELLDDFSIDRGMGSLKLGPVDLSGLVSEAIGRQRHRIERKGQSIQLDMEPGVRALGDPHWLDQLVTALVSNASKFSAHGSRIRVSLRCEDGSAILNVEDEGIGMDAEDLEQVFTRYAVLKGRSTAGEAQGRSTLARARQWAEAHGGSLRAFSSGTGQGSRFALSIPLLR
jgi:signal transduction histidine kinase